MSNNYNQREYQFKVIRNDRQLSNQKSSKQIQGEGESFEQLDTRLATIEKKVGQQNYGIINKLILFILLPLFIGNHIINYQQERQTFQTRLSQLQSKTAQIQNQIHYLQKTILSLREQLNSIHKYNDKLADQIVDMHLNQLTKRQRSMPFLQKYSQPIKLNFQENVASFKNNYRINKKRQSIKKVTNQQAIIYSLTPIPFDKVSYFQIKIEQTQLGMISIGVFTQQKLNRNIDCGYCQGNQMYYIYCKNGQIYHGETLQYYKHSIKSRFERIKIGDVVSLFIDQQQNQLIWYVNGKYAQSQYLEEATIGLQLYPFVLITSINDEVLVLN